MGLGIPAPRSHTVSQRRQRACGGGGLGCVALRRRPQQLEGTFAEMRSPNAACPTPHTPTLLPCTRGGPLWRQCVACRRALPVSDCCCDANAVRPSPPHCNTAHHVAIPHTTLQLHKPRCNTAPHVATPRSILQHSTPTVEVSKAPKFAAAPELHCLPWGTAVECRSLRVSPLKIPSSSTRPTR